MLMNNVDWIGQLGLKFSGLPVACPGIRKGGWRKSERLFFLLFNFSRGAQLKK